jgi:hypothetical protein
MKPWNETRAIKKVYRVNMVQFKKALGIPEEESVEFVMITNGDTWLGKLFKKTHIRIDTKGAK